MDDAEAYDEDVSDQPVDYSKKYTERNASAQNHLAPESGARQPRRVSKKEYSQRDSKVDLFGDYAETDLDQPTDYSLRYAEDDTDEDEKQEAEYFPVSGQEDTVKTYCTEGTPYETPFNFSTATSMSDLRVEDIKESELSKKMPKKPIEIVRESPVSFIEQPDTTPDCDEQDGLITKELEEENPKDTAVLNPGQVTPEKIVSYYEEETSHGFSRANSLSSLSSAVTSPNFQNNVSGDMLKVDSPPSLNKEEAENDDHSALKLNNSQVESPSENDNLSERKTNRVLDKEGKMVTFSDQDYYAEETPLMFSRCSSLGSLSGFEQHSIHDDRSSVISDFSRRTSGIVSPSELPDSPTQTSLPSPRNHKTQNEFVSKLQEETLRPSVRQQLSFSKPQITMNSVFEDEIATFKEESTPIEFSSTTSLSSLTIDDEVKIPNDTKMYCKLERVPDEDEKEVHKLEADMLNMTINNSKSKEKEEQVSDDEDDEDMLAACINMGMQTNRYRQPLKIQEPTQSESPSILVSYQRNSIPTRLEPHATSIETPISTIKTNRTAVDTIASDTVHIYCTEDTPADISPVGSQSNLSALSMPSVQEDVEKTEPDQSAEIDCHRSDLFDEGPKLSNEDEKILNECIQSGIPKARQITLSSTNSISFVKKSETSHVINIYGTPSSSPVEANHANKNPILRPKSPQNDGLNLRQSDDFSDDSLNHSDEEAILTECIQSAMPKARFNRSPSIKQPLSQVRESPKAMNTMQTSSTSSVFLQPRYVEQRKSMPKKRLLFEDNVGLSEEEEDIMLAQCIRSGMPKALNSMSTTVTTSPIKKSAPCSKTTKNFWVPPGSYYMNKTAYSFKSTSLHSPLYKSMNVNTADMRYVRNVSSNLNGFSGRTTSGNIAQSSQMLRNCDNGTRERINNSPFCAPRSSFHHAESENGNSVDNHCVPARSRVAKYTPVCSKTENNDDYACKSTVNVVPLRHSSMSSMNEVDLRTSEQEWNPLKMCITSGMTTNKYCVKGMKPSESVISNGHDDCESIPEDNTSVCSYNSYVFKT